MDMVKLRDKAWITLGVMLMLLAVGCGQTTPAPTLTTSPPNRSPTTRPALTRAPTADPVERLMGTRTIVAATAAVQPTATATLTLPPPTPTLIPSTPRLLLEYEDMSFPTWSPDGQWIAFWARQEGIEIPLMTPGFYHVASGEMCFHDDLTGTFYPSNTPSYSDWQVDGRAVIISDLEAFVGEPCGSFTPGEPEPPPWEWSLSPDGRYRASSTYDMDAGLGTTTITDTATGAALREFTFVHPMIGGSILQWVDVDKLLVMIDEQRGPFIVTMAGEEIDVVPDLFGLEIGRPPVTIWASGRLHGATGDFHILLDTNSVTNERAPLLLYHSETGEVEAIPFRASGGFATSEGYTRGFSPDGGWLLLSMPLDDPGNDYTTDWVRPIDGENEDAFIVAHSGGAFRWSGPTELVAFNEQLPTGSPRVVVMTFPGGEVVQEWSVEGYHLGPVEWSPDGTMLLLMGWSDENARWGLFLAEVVP